MSYCPHCGAAKENDIDPCGLCGGYPHTAASNVPPPVPINSPWSSYTTGAPPSRPCAACGLPLIQMAVHCPRCGTPQGQNKSKTAAVLLAVFLSFWTWLYTYKRDYAKFWVGMGLQIAGFILLLAFGLGALVWLGVWIWAVVDTASKPDSYYLYYRTS